MNKRGLRITIDGGSKGSGRTYLAEKVCAYLGCLGYDVIIVNESISSPAGIEEVSKLHDVTIIEREIEQTILKLQQEVKELKNE